MTPIAPAPTEEIDTSTPRTAPTATVKRATRRSDIRPIREMGVWGAVGLFMTWIIVFTLFPALQKVLQATRAMANSEARIRAVLTQEQIHWMEHYLFYMKALDLVEPEEERHQWVFHIMVSGRYADWRETQDIVPVERPEPATVTADSRAE